MPANNPKKYIKPAKKPNKAPKGKGSKADFNKIYGF